MSRRRLRPDELALWEEVARKATPLAPERKPQPGTLGDTARPKPKPVTPRSTPVEPFTVGQSTKGQACGHDVLPGIAERIANAPVKMDKKAHARLKRGKLMPEAKLDLHGMTLDQAHPALHTFIRRSHAAGLRLVLVVTGKGKHRDPGGPIPVRHGVLRHNVPQWLRMMPLAPLVLQISEAHLKHGGGGAYYVYLRRQR
mgnify:CR=1 FL=1